MAHEAAVDVREVTASEPEVAAVADGALLDMRDEHDVADLCRALVRVDAQLADILREGLAPSQRDRSTAELLRNRLSSFCAQYGQNALHALRGEPFIPRGRCGRLAARCPEGREPSGGRGRACPLRCGAARRLRLDGPSARRRDRDAAGGSVCRRGRAHDGLDRVHPRAAGSVRSGGARSGTRRAQPLRVRDGRTGPGRCGPARRSGERGVRRRERQVALDVRGVFRRGGRMVSAGARARNAFGSRCGITAAAGASRGGPICCRRRARARRRIDAR